MQDINNRIKQEFCSETTKHLTDEELFEEYKNCLSVKNQTKKLATILEKYIMEPETKEKIIEEYLIELIPPGTKGVLRGNKFNAIVKNKIEEMSFDNNFFEIKFEAVCPQYITSEIPDWYILEKSSNKIIIGMNQLDLWGGGAQINRGSKYLLDCKYNTEKSKLVCVISNEIQFTSNKSKAYKFFEIGFQNNTLCYMKNLENIIRSFFEGCVYTNEDFK